MGNLDSVSEAVLRSAPPEEFDALRRRFDAAVEAREAGRRAAAAPPGAPPDSPKQYIVQRCAAIALYRMLEGRQGDWVFQDEPMSLAEIGRKFGKTGEAVRRLKEKLIDEHQGGINGGDRRRTRDGRR